MYKNTNKDMYMNMSTSMVRVLLWNTDDDVGVQIRMKNGKSYERQVSAMTMILLSPPPMLFHMLFMMLIY